VPAAPLSVSASAVRLSSTRPTAGSAVTASVRVAQGAVPVRPSRVGCRGSVGSVKLTGRPAAALGRASCTYRPPKTAKGQRLRGVIAFTAQGQRFTRRFSTTLR
jgi:hypothetical protein